MHRGQVFVAIAEVVLAELPGGAALRLQYLRDARIVVSHSWRLSAEPELNRSLFSKYCRKTDWGC